MEIERAEVTKKDLKEKLYNERKAFRQQKAMLEKAHKDYKRQCDDAIEEIKTASNNLTSTFVRTFGEQTAEGEFTASIPVPEGGWLTAARKDGAEYIVKTVRIDDDLKKVSSELQE